MKFDPKYPWDKPYAEWSDEQILACLQDAFLPEPAPPCSVCGGKLTFQYPGLWACSAYEAGGNLKPGRIGGADDHYVRSRWEERSPGNPLAMEALARWDEARMALDMEHGEVPTPIIRRDLGRAENDS